MAGFPQHYLQPQRPSYPMVIVNQSPNGQGAAYHHSYEQQPQHRPPLMPQVNQQRPMPQQKPPPAHRPVMEPDMDVKPVITPQLPPDYSVLLLSLADQYINAARRLTPFIAYSQPGADSSKYHELISAGLRCIECSLLHPNFKDREPREQALLHLKFASLLFEETANYGAIEELLSKAMVICDRNRFLDLKYSMEHLLARALSKTNLRMALKHVDNVLTQCETLRCAPWIYAFQFLRCSILLQLGSNRDVHAALTGMKRVSEVARQRNDSEIGIVAALTQASIHLRMRKEDSVAEIQRALAGARGQLSNYAPKELPHLYVLAHQLDLASSLDPFDHSQVQTKLSAMQQLMDNGLFGVQWRRDRMSHIRVNPAGVEQFVADTGGIFTKEDGHGIGLGISWLGRVEAYALGFLLCAQAVFQRNARDRKSEVYLKEALNATGDDQAISDAPLTVPLLLACEKAAGLRRLRCVVLVQLAFALAFRADWGAAQTMLQRSRKLLASSQPPQPLLTTTLDYLQGVIYQGQGNFDAALEAYQAQSLSMQASDANSLSAIKVVQLLRTLNMLLIVHDPSHHSHSLVPDLVETLRPHFPMNGGAVTNASTSMSQHADLMSAYALITAMLQQKQGYMSHNGPTAAGDGMARSIVASKQAMQTALNSAQKAHNPLLITLCLSYMHHLFFGGIYDEQAERLAQGCVVQANEAGSAIWADIAKFKLTNLKGHQRPNMTTAGQQRPM